MYNILHTRTCMRLINLKYKYNSTRNINKYNLHLPSRHTSSHEKYFVHNNESEVKRL